MNQSLPRVAIIYCAVLEDEIRHYASLAPALIHQEMMPQGLHNEPDRLRRDLQVAIDRIENETSADTIVLGYGLCSRGTVGVKTQRCRLVMARAHDCITLLLGSKEKYAQYVAENPGTYWYSPGWNRHHVPPGEERYQLLFKEYVEKYGEDNAQFLMESEQAWFSSYDRATYIELGAGVTDDDVAYTRRCAEWLGWKFDYQRGNPALLQALLTGEWDEERFVILEPGQVFHMTADERVMTAAREQPEDPTP